MFAAAIPSIPAPAASSPRVFVGIMVRHVMRFLAGRMRARASQPAPTAQCLAAKQLHMRGAVHMDSCA